MNFLYIALGLFAFALGTLGIFLPLMPTVPFYLLSAFLLSKGSKKWHNWLTSNKLYTETMSLFTQNASLPLKVRVRIFISVTLLLGVSFYFLHSPAFRIFLSLVWLVHIYFIFLKKSKKD